MADIKYTVHIVDADNISRNILDFKGEKKVALIDFANPVDRAYIGTCVADDSAFEGRTYDLNRYHLIIGKADEMDSADFLTLIRQRIVSYPESPALPNSIYVRLVYDNCAIDEPNRGSVEFHTSATTGEEFRKQVREAVKEWIETDFDSYRHSESSTGRGYLDSMDEDDPDTKKQALNDGATWDMVYADLPTRIALKHGFLPMSFTVTLEEDEYAYI